MDLSHKPWNTLDDAASNEVLLPRGMIGPEERRCYHYLARYGIDGEGEIVDAGSFVGASAFCFASGAARNEHIGASRQLIHCYDQFRANEDYVLQFITDSLRPIRAAESFFDIFEWQTAKYRNMIVPHEGDFLNTKWNRSPISILFIDIAKGSKLNSHVVDQFFPYVIPEKSYVIQQDFYHAWHPYIHITMEFLSHRFEIVDGFVPFNSRIYRVLSRPSDDEIRRLANYDFSPDERLELLDRFIGKESGGMRAMARTLKLCQLWMDGNLAGYADERKILAAEFPDGGWARELDALVARGEACQFF